MPIQLITPTSDSVYRGATTSQNYALGAAASEVNPAQHPERDRRCAREVLHVLHDVVLPALQQTTWAPVTLSADQQQALSDIQAAILPAIPGHDLPGWRRTGGGIRGDALNHGAGAGRAYGSK